MRLVRLGQVTSESRWRHAVSAWSDGDQVPVLRLLLADDPIPAFAREWLGNALLGRVKQRRGPKRHRVDFARIGRNAFIVNRFNFWRAVGGNRGDTPTGNALALVAEEFGLSEDAVSRVVFPRKARKTPK